MKDNWYKIGIEETFKKLGSSHHGLTETEAEKRKREGEKNRLPEEKRLSGLTILLSQLKSSLVYILLIASVVSFFLGDFINAYVILAAVIINVIIGFFQEFKAQNSLKKLKEVIRVRALVIRGGNEKQVNLEDILVGDVIVLSAGDKIPADARIISCKNFTANEASLTGESYPIDKFSHKIDKDLPLPDRQNMVYLGTVVADGTGQAVVVAIGKNTEIGKIASLVKETPQDKTPLQVKLTRFSRKLAVIILAVSTFLFVIGIVRGKEFNEMFTTAVAVAVSAIPEGLLIAVTLILTIGMQRILKKKALARNLLAAETLGSTTVICTDKTGTLTEGIMHVSQIITNRHDYAADREGMAIKKDGMESFIFALKIGMLCNDAFIENEEEELKNWKIIGNPTEKALLNAGVKLGLRKSELEKLYKRIDEIPFDSNIKYMATLNHYTKEQNIVFVKGAPEKILGMSEFIDDDGKKINLTPQTRDRLKKTYEHLSNKGLRILAFGYKRVGHHYNKFENFLEEDNKKIIFIGFMAIKDPLRPDTKETVDIVKKAGIKVVMITGDHKLTAQSIAEELGLPSKSENILEGEELKKMSDHDLKNRVRGISVYARVSPKDKLRIVDAWQANNEVVAMTGDGVNDAPALKSANIGVALGSGTDVAKETAGLVLLQNNFKTIQRAVEEGRVIFDNIKKVVLYLISDSFAEITLIVIGLILGFPLPILAAQVLWINLVADTFPALAMTMEPKEGEVMKEKPKGLLGQVLNREMKVLIAIISLSNGFFSLLGFYYFWKITGDILIARTTAFAILGLSTVLLAFSVRSLRYPIWRKNPFRNKFLVLAVFFGIFLLVSGIYIPFLQPILRTTNLYLSEWLFIIGVIFIIIFFVEFIKYLFLSREKNKEEINKNT